MTCGPTIFGGEACGSPAVGYLQWEPDTPKTGICAWHIKLLDEMMPISSGDQIFDVPLMISKGWLVLFDGDPPQ